MCWHRCWTFRGHDENIGCECPAGAAAFLRIRAVIDEPRWRGTPAQAIGDNPEGVSTASVLHVPVGVLAKTRLPNRVRRRILERSPPLDQILPRASSPGGLNWMFRRSPRWPPLRQPSGHGSADPTEVAARTPESAKQMERRRLFC